MAVPVSELQKISPSAIIELFTLTLDSTLHGNSDTTRFHNGSAPNNNNEIIWQGQSFLRMPIESTGYERTGKGALPRPSLKVSNLFGTMTAMMLDANAVTPFIDLCGSKLVRIRTCACYLDAANWPDGVNPFGTPANNEMPQEIYFLDRKVTENRDYVEWELASALDLNYGPKAPKRLITRAEFPGVGTFVS